MAYLVGIVNNLDKFEGHITLPIKSEKEGLVLIRVADNTDIHHQVIHDLVGGYLESVLVGDTGLVCYCNENFLYEEGLRPTWLQFQTEIVPTRFMGNIAIATGSAPDTLGLSIGEVVALFEKGPFEMDAEEGKMLAAALATLLNIPRKMDAMVADLKQMVKQALDPEYFSVVFRVYDKDKFQAMRHSIISSHLSREVIDKIGANAICVSNENMAEYDDYAAFVGSAIDAEDYHLHTKLPDFEEWRSAGMPEKYDPKADYRKDT